jgi:hypothetical protein
VADTIQDKIDILKGRKGDLYNAIISGDTPAKGWFDTSEIDYLFSAYEEK